MEAIAERRGDRISLVIPAWNEQETIAQAIHEAVAALSAAAADYEVIVVDDGSTDSTADLVRHEARANPKVRLIQQPRHVGYGAALRAGLQAATLDRVAVTDADCQFHLSELEYMLPLARRYDITWGYRINRQEPAGRRLFSWGYSTLVGLLMGSPVRDVDCALKVFRRDKLVSILPDCENSFANAEMLTKARLQGLSIVEVGVHHRPRAAGESKASLLDLPKTLSALLRFWWSRVLFPATQPSPVRPQRWFWIGLFVLALAAGVQLFSGLDYPMFEPDEGRYAEIPREMVASGDWIIPTLHYEPYLEKPPLLYWWVAGSYRLFGVHDWSARVVPALATWLTILSTMLFARRHFGSRTALLSGVALLLCVGFIAVGRFLLLDSLLMLWVVLALFTAHEAVQGRRLNWPWWLVSAVCCGLGVLTKGVIALVLLAPPVFAFGWLSDCPWRPRLRGWSAYLLVIFLIAAPWFLAAALRYADFTYAYLWHEHVDRFVNGMNHPAPLWYYLPVLLVGGLPWALFLWPLLQFQFSRLPGVSAARPRAAGFYLLAAVWCLAFFSLSSCKLPTYILPAFPCLAVLLGVYLNHFVAQWSPGGTTWAAGLRLPRVAAALLCVLAMAVSATGWLLGTERGWGTIVESGGVAAILLAVILTGQRMPRAAVWAVCGCLLFFVTFEVNREVVPLWAVGRSPMHGSGHVSRILQNEELPVVVYGKDWGSVPFYLRRDDVRHFDTASVADLNEFLRDQPQTLIVCRENRAQMLGRLLPSELQFKKVGRSGPAEVLMVSHRPAAARAAPGVQRR